jgi:O-antigen/teichoic acid export membrane protein
MADNISQDGARMSSVRRSLAYSALDGYVATLLQIASTVVIARLLTPEQVGVFAVAAVFAALASALRDFGVAEYLIQEQQLDDTAIRAALTVNLAVSWAMAALLFVAASPIAAFYRHGEVASVMHLMALNFVLIPFGAVTLAWFRRELDFRPILVANVAGNLCSFTVSVTLALLGHGAMSLAWGSLASITVTVGVSVLLRPRWFPRWPGVAGIGRVVHFGKFASGITILGQIGKGAPEMIIGRALDMADVGMFSRGAGLVEVFHRLVLRTVNLVALPYFARGVREQGSSAPGLLRTVALITGLGWPFLAFMGVAAYPVIRLMYGPQWLDAVPLAQILCAAAAVELVYHPTKDALLALGKARECNLLQTSVQAQRLAGLLLTVPFGLEGAAWGLAAASLGGALHSQLFLTHFCGVGGRDVARALGPSARVTVCVATPLAVWSLLDTASEANYLRQGVLGGLLCLAVWLFCVRAFDHVLWSEVARGLNAARQRLGLH